MHIESVYKEVSIILVNAYSKPVRENTLHVSELNPNKAGRERGQKEK